ncbi:GNAT family N-acetyltransferase [uncultured Senegalimassilia sp.]|uniref:GNAT family N-acetyltransferase n=1 Tax=uncultured Senegalimassilia sp. TaxID=1714350 RepID=UPI0025E078F9|nr:GNAT family N-acetyltransferase [uncultured Senegalimassilia sp.]
MEPVEYRPLQDKDIEAAGVILGNTWHTYADGRKRVVSGIVDLANFAQRNTFTEVAVVNDSPIGVIMARAGAFSEQTQAHWKIIEQDARKELDELGGSSADLVHFFKTAKQADRALLAQSGCDPDFELVLFAVSDKVRGLGIGSTLMDHAQRYLAAQGASKAFLFTDTDCTWEYYEHRGMRRAAEQSFAENAASILPERMFVYEMDLKDIGR